MESPLGPVEPSVAASASDPVQSRVAEYENAAANRQAEIEKQKQTALLTQKRQEEDRIRKHRMIDLQQRQAWTGVAKLVGLFVVGLGAGYLFRRFWR